MSGRCEQIARYRLMPHDDVFLRCERSAGSRTRITEEELIHATQDGPLYQDAHRGGTA